jgi:hypothetical protein
MAKLNTAGVTDMDVSLVTNRPLVWLRRYLLAELVCTVAALLCAWLATVLTGSVAATASSC